MTVRDVLCFAVWTLLDFYLFVTPFILLQMHECPRLNKVGEWPARKMVAVEAQCSEC